MASHVAAGLAAQGHEAEARGSTVHLKSGGKIEIGNKGERSYHGASAAAQNAAEAHLAAHADKHVRDWAAKTQPAPPPARAPRKVDPEKAAAREKQRTEKKEARTAARAERTKAREAKSAERTHAKTERQKARTERAQAKEQKKAAAVEQLRAINAPIKDGKLDASRVPGATKDFRPLTTLDPESGYRGRSYKARDAGEMRSEFLGAAAGGGGASNNEQILSDQLGHLDVKDPTQWESISEKYETGPIETFADAFKVLAKQSAGGGRQPDWSRFDFEALREAPGLGKLQMPAWLQEAQNDHEMKQGMAAAYDAAEHSEPRESSDESEPYEPVEEPGYNVPTDEEIPFERV